MKKHVLQHLAHPDQSVSECLLSVCVQGFKIRSLLMAKVKFHRKCIGPKKKKKQYREGKEYRAFGVGHQALNPNFP